MKASEAKALLAHAAPIVEGYDTGVTLRQLFYRLVADGSLPNTKKACNDLGSVTAKARRQNQFPQLVDRTRRISRPLSFEDAEQARRWLQKIFKLDRTDGQEFALYVGCEKDALSALLDRWLTPYSIPVLVFRGNSSVSYNNMISEAIEREDRKTVLLYLGDLDPNGEDIQRKVQEDIGFDDIVRIALTNEQKIEMNLLENAEAVCDQNPPPPWPKAMQCPPEFRDGQSLKCKLHRTPNGTKKFYAKYGRLFQVEVDSIPPDTLQELVMGALGDYLSKDVYDEVLQREAAESERL